MFQDVFGVNQKWWSVGVVARQNKSKRGSENIIWTSAVALPRAATATLIMEAIFAVLKKSGGPFSTQIKIPSSTQMHFRECGLIKKSINSKEDKKSQGKCSKKPIQLSFENSCCYIVHFMTRGQIEYSLVFWGRECHISALYYYSETKTCLWFRLFTSATATRVQSSPS